MNPSKLALAVASIGLLAAAPAARAVPFTITDATQTIGSGYGSETESAGSTLLDVQFTDTFSAQSFSLSAVGDVTSPFTIGRVNFLESDASGGILNAETDNLDVSWTLTFTNPLAAGEAISATATATVGAINGGAENGSTDYALTWGDPLIVNFGAGGQFNIDLSDLFFKKSESLKDQTATITLLALPAPPIAPLAVSEPGSLGLLGLGLVGIGLVRRRRGA